MRDYCGINDCTRIIAELMTVPGLLTVPGLVPPLSRDWCHLWAGTGATSEKYWEILRNSWKYWHFWEFHENTDISENFWHFWWFSEIHDFSQFPFVFPNFGFGTRLGGGPDPYHVGVLGYAPCPGTTTTPGTTTHRTTAADASTHCTACLHGVSAGIPGYLPFIEIQSEPVIATPAV